MSRGNLRGKVAVVTGAARGLGAALALELHRRGARLALVGLEREELERTARRCDADWWEADVTDETALAAVAAEIRGKLGGTDILVVNAGIAAAGPLLHSDPAAYERVIEVNLVGSVRTVRTFLPQVIERRGYVLQVASLAAMAPAPLMSAYAASKAGVEAFAHALRSEVRHHGVDVGVAYLSWTDTDMVRGGDAVEGLRDLRARMPGFLGRTYPVEPAARALVDGIAGRSAHVYGQRWLRVMPLLRGFVPSVTTRISARHVPAAVRAIEDAGTEVTLPVGPGGIAGGGAAITKKPEPARGS